LSESGDATPAVMGTFHRTTADERVRLQISHGADAGPRAKLVNTIRGFEKRQPRQCSAEVVHRIFCESYFSQASNSETVRLVQDLGGRR
jgi:hypothetical protein